MPGLQQRLVSLDVHVNVRWQAARHGVEAVGSAGKRRVRHHAAPSTSTAQVFDFRGIGRNDDFIKLRAGVRGANYPDQQGLAGDLPQDFPWQARGSEPRGYHAENASHRGDLLLRWPVHRPSSASLFLRQRRTASRVTKTSTTPSTPAIM